MKRYTESEINEIETLIRAFKPYWFECIVEDKEAPLPKAFPDALGKNMVEAMLLVLRYGDAEIRRQCAHEIWYALPDVSQLHEYAGFHILCDSLSDE